MTFIVDDKEKIDKSPCLEAFTGKTLCCMSILVKVTPPPF